MLAAMARAPMILLLALAAIPARALPPVSFDLSVDPRFELLGVVRQLSESRPAGDSAAEYPRRIEKRFGAFRHHPAVELYQDLVLRRSREEAAATMLIYYSNPPELALKDKNADIHYANGPGEAEELQRFLQELRDFARASDFAGFFADNRAYYAQRDDAARKTLGAVDPIARIERYLGLSLSSRAHYILLLRPAATHAFIVPYPLPPANAGTKMFDVYTMSPEFNAGIFSNNLWPEPLYVFIDPSFYYFEKLNIPVPADFYGPEVARCRSANPDCVKHFAATALLRHIAGVPAISGKSGDDARLESRLVEALSARLDEYDAHRDRYPTLWDFYPRWFAVFEEAAFPGRAPRSLAVPAEPKISKASDFFEPAVSEALLRPGAR
jgi:hypothetical protein